MTRKFAICAISGSRADYGLLVSPLRAIRNDQAFALSLVLTGQHLVQAAGNTRAKVIEDGFEVAAEVDMHLASDDPKSVIKSAGVALGGMAEVLTRLAPDLVLILGDRYEIAAAALAATIARIPLAHIAGGDVTEGAFDDAFRHAITKMSHLHFVTNEVAARRVRQLGEDPVRVHVVGSPGLDLVRTSKVMSREEFWSSVGLRPRRTNLIVTFHPETLAPDTLVQLDEMLAALTTLGSDVSVLFTGSNADPAARHIEGRIQEYVAQHSSAHLLPSLGSERFFAALTYMDAVVGNSSSGLYEAPSFGLPTINIGGRQAGRLKAESVFDCPGDRGAICAAIDAALVRGRQSTSNPYGDGHASDRIVSVLKSIHEPRVLLSKRFVDLEVA